MHQQHARHIAILSDIEEAAYGYGLDDGKALADQQGNNQRTSSGSDAFGRSDAHPEG